jgi:uroporphyrinogen-III synthase
VRAIVERRIAVAVFLTGIGARTLLAAAASVGLREDVTAALNGGVVVARGPKARSALRGAGVHVDMEPADPTTRGILASLTGARLHGCDVLVQLHGRRDATLREGLESLGARVLEVPLYRYVPAVDEGQIIDWIGRTARGEVYAITFTSPPAVLGLFAAADHASVADVSTAALTRAIIVAVGPTTGDTLEELGVRPDVVPTTYTQPALVEALAAHARGLSGAASRPASPLDRAVEEVPRSIPTPLT